MIERQQDIESLFFDAVEGQKETPPARLWAELEYGLDKSDLLETKIKYRLLKRYSMIMMAVAAAAILLLLQSDNREIGQGQILGSDSVTTKALLNSTGINQTTSAGGTGEVRPEEVKDSVYNKSGLPLVKATNKQNDEAYHQLNANDLQSSYQPLVRSSKMVNAVRKKHKFLLRASTADNNASSKIEGLAVNDKQHLVSTAAKQKLLQSTTIKSIDNKALTIDMMPPSIKTATKAPVDLNPKKLHQLLGLSIAPYAVAGFHFNEEGNGKNHRSGHDGRGYSEIHSFVAGFNLQLPIYKRWSASTGIAYRYQQENILSDAVVANRVNNGTAQYIFNFNSGWVYLSQKNGNSPVAGDSLTIRDAVAGLHYLSVPVAINYTLLTGRVQLIPSIGVNANFLLASRLQGNVSAASNTAMHQEYKIMGAPAFFLDPTAAFTIQYNASKKISVTVTPSVNTRFFGLSAGARYFFH